MADGTGIQWTDATWNPVTGCDRVSEGCDHCYAADLAGRWWAGQYPPNEDGSPRRFEDVRLHPDRLAQPLKWRRPRRVFVNSVSDLFHDAIPDAFIAKVWGVMYQAHQHVFQILTKRPGRMASLVGRLDFIEAAQLHAESLVDDPEDIYVQDGPWPPKNVWLGTSVENQRWADIRIPQLLRTVAAVRFLSAEPLLGPIDLDGLLREEERHVPWYTEDGAGIQAETLRYGGDRLIDWVIVGGESGPKHRPMDMAWVRDLRDQCNAAEVAFFFKQVGGRTPKAGGRDLDGRTWDEYPNRDANGDSA